MKVFKEFKDFATRGNVVDLAIGIIIGGAFGKIVSSLVADIIMPPIGLLIGGVNFTDIRITLKDAILDVSGKITYPAVTLNLGNFLQAVFDFIIIAFAIFLLIKGINRIQRKKQESPVKEVVPSNEEVLLTEIRDILKNKN